MSKNITGSFLLALSLSEGLRNKIGLYEIIGDFNEQKLLEPNNYFTNTFMDLWNHKKHSADRLHFSSDSLSFSSYLISKYERIDKNSLFRLMSSSASVRTFMISIFLRK